MLNEYWRPNRALKYSSTHAHPFYACVDVYPSVTSPRPSERWLYQSRAVPAVGFTRRFPRSHVVRVSVRSVPSWTSAWRKTKSSKLVKHKHPSWLLNFVWLWRVCSSRCWIVCIFIIGLSLRMMTSSHNGTVRAKIGEKVGKKLKVSVNPKSFLCVLNVVICYSNKNKIRKRANKQIRHL